MRRLLGDLFVIVFVPLVVMALGVIVVVVLTRG